ncbi:hypothetical protein MOF23_07015 [Bacillus inaquosorum]|uniref:hypothetical protein n=1 Tax=Bacillus inaquosorum TaxID=483913 RepID=UPI0022808A35|nr:hypothetical protein [Bacillus inaquosorum]MCY9308726.1 hypothetical protein [Bacillus inaquosorum]
MSALNDFLQLVGNDQSAELTPDIISSYHKINPEERWKFIDQYRAKAEDYWKKALKNEGKGGAIEDVYKAQKGPNGRAVYSLGLPDASIKYAPHLKDAEKLSVLKRGADSLDSYEISMFKKIAASHNLKNFDGLHLNAGLDVINDERKRITEEIHRIESKEKPPINNTKIHQTTEKYSQHSESFNTQTKTPPPTPPKSEPKPENLPKVKSPHSVKTNVVNTKEVSRLLKNNRSKIFLGALGVGLVKSAVDGDDDSLGSSIEKGAKTGALASGLSFTAEHLFKTETVQDLVKGEVSDISSSVRKKADAERIIKAGGKLGGALRVGKYAFAAATVLDIMERAADHHAASDLKAQEEYNNKQKEKQKRNKQKQYSYGHINQGEILFDLFNSRTGHYKMGNAKFN